MLSTTLLPYPNMEIVCGSDINTAIQDKAISDCVERYKKRIGIDDPIPAMQMLSSSSQLFKLAYAGSKGFKCSLEIANIWNLYHSFVNESTSVAASFERTCIHSIEIHAKILNAKQDEFLKTLKLLKHCSENASEMAKKTAKLVENCRILCELSGNTFLSTKAAEEAARESQDEIKNELNKFKIEKKGYESLIHLQQKELDEAKQEIEAAEKALRESQEGNWFLSGVMNVVSSIATNITAYVFSKPAQTDVQNESPLIKILTEQNERLELEITDLENELNMLSKNVEEENEFKIKALKENLELKRQLFESKNNLINKVGNIARSELLEEQRLIEAKQEKANIKSKQIEANVMLVKVVEKLQQLNVGENDLDKAIISLEIAVQTLGKIKTIFEITRTFWKSMHEGCKYLLQLGSEIEYVDKSSQEAFVEEIKGSGLKWLALGHICYQISESMKEVCQSANHDFSTIPTKQEAINFIKEKTERIIEVIEKENSSIKLLL